MSKDEVRLLLGEPDRVFADGLIFFHDSDRLDSWSEN